MFVTEEFLSYLCVWYVCVVCVMCVFVMCVWMCVICVNAGIDLLLWEEKLEESVLLCVSGIRLRPLVGCEPFSLRVPLAPSHLSSLLELSGSGDLSEILSLYNQPLLQLAVLKAPCTTYHWTLTISLCLNYKPSCVCVCVCARVRAHTWFSSLLHLVCPAGGQTPDLCGGSKPLLPDLPKATWNEPRITSIFWPS